MSKERAARGSQSTGTRAATRPRPSGKPSAFVVWRYRVFDGSAPLERSLTAIDNDDEVDSEYVEIIAGGTSTGARRRADWPKSAAVRLREAPTGALQDVLTGTSYLIVSAKIGRVLKKVDRNIELLRLKVLHNQTTLADDYVLVNPPPVSCMNTRASKPRTIDGMIFEVAQLVLREDEIPSDAAVFRLREWPVVIVMRRTLAREFEGAGGFSVVEPRDHR